MGSAKRLNETEKNLIDSLKKEKKNVIQIGKLSYYNPL